MGWLVVRHIRKRLRDLPRDAKNRPIAREVLRDVKSILELVETAGYKLDATETKFFKEIPAVIGGAIRGAVLDSIEPSNRSRINFDVAYLAEGDGYTLTISAPKRTGDIEVVLQAPSPERKASGARTTRRGPAARSKKRAPARKRRSR